MDETTTSGGGGSWESWFQGVGANVIDKYASSNWTQPFELQKLKIQATGSTGATYTEGTAAKPGLSISPTMLLLAGAAVVALLMLRD